MEGDDGNSRAQATAVEWVIRLLLFALTVTAVWTVFGDDLGLLLGR